MFCGDYGGFAIVLAYYCSGGGCYALLVRLGRGVRGGVVMYGWGRKEMGMLRGDVLDSSLGLKVNLRASYLDWVARTSWPKVMLVPLRSSV